MTSFSAPTMNPRFAISTSLDRETIDKFFTWTASRRFLRAGRQATTKCP
jgi:hypothetical protein